LKVSLDEIEKFLYENFPFLKEILLIRNFNIPKECLIASRSQYNAECIFDYAVKQKSNGFFLMIISEDIYIRDLNYVFGIGATNLGSIVSTFRIENDIESLYKIILHEIGHVFGLKHCLSPCSMAPSNNLYDLHQMQASYCLNCKLKLDT
jgi:archaemetzincin